MMRLNVKLVFPDGLEPEGQEEQAQWLLRCLKDIDKHSGRCRIVIDVAQSTLVTLSAIIEEEISKLGGEDSTKHGYDEWFDRKTLEDLRKIQDMLDEADRESLSRYASSGRPQPYDMRLGDPVKISFTREWMELVMREELASVKSPKGKQA